MTTQLLQQSLHLFTLTLRKRRASIIALRLLLGALALRLRLVRVPILWFLRSTGALSIVRAGNTLVNCFSLCSVSSTKELLATGLSCLLLLMRVWGLLVAGFRGDRTGLLGRIVSELQTGLDYYC